MSCSFRRSRNANKSIKNAEAEKNFMRNFYSHLKSKLNKKLFDNIINWICSSEVVVAVLQGNNAVAKTRKICGPTNPKEAKKGTIRGDFSNDDLVKTAKQNKPVHNIIHSSGSREEARKEIKMFRKLL